jgi:hypothetical protein
MALTVAFLALAAAVVSARNGMSARRRGDKESADWMILTALILLSPLVLFAGPLG